jgi:hypothetical protein
MTNMGRVLGNAGKKRRTGRGVRLAFRTLGTTLPERSPWATTTAALKRVALSSS